MKSCKPRWAKPLIDWVERELTAVMAVAIVLAFIFSQSLATDENTADSLASTATGNAVISQQVGALWDNGNSMVFGSVIDGTNSSTIIWSGGAPVNLGTCIFAPTTTTMTTSVNPGTYMLKVTGQDTTVKISGVTYTIAGYGSQTKQVTLSSGQISVQISGGGKIFKIEAVTSADDSTTESGSSGTSTMVPLTSFTVFPNNKNIVLNPAAPTTFTPLTMIRTSLGATVEAAIAWKSSNEKVASVDDKGIVTAHTTGTVTITGTVVGTNLTASTTVTVLASVSAPVVDVTPTQSEQSGSTDTDTTTGLLDNLIDSLTGDKTAKDETAAPTTDGTTEEADQAALDKLAEEQQAEELLSGHGKNILQDKSTDAGYFSDELVQSTAVDTYVAVQAKKLAETGKTTLSQGEIRAIVNTQTTATAKIGARFQLAVKEIAQTFKEIGVGNSYQLPTGETVKKQSALQKIGTWFKNTFTTGAGAAAPVKSDLGEGDELL
ncbi:MAG: Ig-like domain-containing protein [Patescibacteria group bacterium]|jgi:hypothetical protein